MRNTFTKVAAGAFACTAMMQAQVAQAQEACVAQEDLSDAVIYAVPVLAQTLETRCAAELSPDGFLATQGDTFVAPYVALNEASWPGASRVLTVFAESRSGGESGIPALADLFSSQSPDVVRPFVDAMLGTMVAREIKVKDCAKIERGLSLMAPLPPENMGGLVTFIMDVAGAKKPKLCPLDGE